MGSESPSEAEFSGFRCMEVLLDLRGSLPTTGGRTDLATRTLSSLPNTSFGFVRYWPEEFKKNKGLTSGYPRRRK
jgi:hypothetical protein